jgi:hypothetical protein
MTAIDVVGGRLVGRLQFLGNLGAELSGGDQLIERLLMLTGELLKSPIPSFPVIRRLLSQPLEAHPGRPKISPSRVVLGGQGAAMEQHP